MSWRHVRLHLILKHGYFFDRLPVIRWSRALTSAQSSTSAQALTSARALAATETKTRLLIIKGAKSQCVAPPWTSPR